MKDPAVAAFVDALEPNPKKQVEAVRKTILSANEAIEEGIKWNVPSFRTTEWFATFADAKDVKAKLPALKKIVVEWIARL